MIEVNRSNVRYLHLLIMSWDDLLIANHDLLIYTKLINMFDFRSIFTPYNPDSTAITISCSTFLVIKDINKVKSDKSVSASSIENLTRSSTPI